jgi:hypothetical protein
VAGQEDRPPARRPGLLANQNWNKMVGRPVAAAGGGGGGLILGDRQAQGACWDKLGMPEQQKNLYTLNNIQIGFIILLN